MYQIKLEPGEKTQIAQGNQKVLKEVMEREVGKIDTLLREQVDYSTFRFYQGMAQTFEAVIKTLPS